MIIKGQEITRIRAIGSRYNSDSIEVWVGEDRYLLPVKEILAFDTDFNNLCFKVIKKIKHKYLEVVQIDDEEWVDFE